MSELKHTFTSGRMDKDRDERLLKNGSYRDALNIQISSSEGSDVGAIENLLGNEKLSNLNLTNAKTIGSIDYSLKDKLYWFITSDNLDAIYEYDEKQSSITPVLLDSKETKTIVLENISIDSNVDSELILREYNNSELLEICGVPALPILKDQEVLLNNNVILTCSDPSINISIPKNTVIKLDENSDIVFKNIMYDGVKYGNINITTEIVRSGILNFSKNNLITGINIIDDLLFWTDNLNEPRRIHIPTFKKYTSLSDGGDTQIEYIVKNLATGESSKQKRPFGEHDITVIRKAPMSAPTMELYDSAGTGIISIQETLNLFEYNIGDIIEIKNRSTNPNWKVGDFVNISSLDGLINLTASVKSITDDLTENKLIELSIATIEGDITNESIQYIIDLKQKKPLYELNFVRFAYRWKYKNGEYSVFSPFTEPAFIPGLFRYDGKEAFNYGMINKLQRVLLNNFDKGDDTVEEIDILFKEGRNQNIYTLKTVKKLDFPDSFEITKEQIHSVVPNDQLLRQWDNVPKRAKAQEVTANRVIYGNYYQNYNVYTDPDFSVSLKTRTDNYSRTIKSDRTYQLGVVYMDEYNRQTPVLSNDTGTFKVDKFNSISKNKFEITLNNQPPAWATHFKYFVKDTSGEYYNLAADRFYEDKENGFTYVSFPSSDRNKITTENYLLLKKYHGSDEAVLFDDNRYKVIEIFSDPPEFVHEKLEQIDAFQNVLFAPSFGDGATATSKTAGSTPVSGKTTIQLRSINTDGTATNPSSTDQGIPDVSKANLKVGKYIRFFIGNKKTDKYKIRSVRYHLDGDDECEIRVDTPFGDDVNILYTDPSSASSPLKADVEMRIYEDSANAGDKEFDGRFFVKLKTNGALQQSIEDGRSSDDDGIEYVAKYTVTFDGVDRNERNRVRTGVSATPIFIRNGGLTTNGLRDTSGKRRLIGNKEAHITFEQTGPEDDNSFIRNLQVGSKIRFSNHDTIYRIGAINSDPNFKYGDHEVYRVDIRFEDADGNETPLTQDLVAFKTNLAPNYLSVDLLEEKDPDQIPFIPNPAIFETEPIEQKTELDIYYETEKSFPISLHGLSQEIEWYNAISFGNGVESNRIRDDFNAIFIDTGVKASTVLAEPFKEEHKFNGIIWSGIINSRSGTNQSNQFNVANPITKDLLPSYGSIQKLHAWDDRIIMLCEDKIVGAYADKDVLYNADGNTNVVATNRVIGSIQPYNGEYGISTNPESFADYGFRCYFADKMRGTVLRLSKDGLTPISKADMSDFFRDRLFNSSGYLMGSYDNRNSLYNITFENLDTVCFAENVSGWVTRKSFIPEWGISLNDKFYTYENSELWLHDSTSAARNNFYGQQHTSTVEFEINDDPSTVKKYKTLGYEGTAGWIADVTTDQQKSSQITFIDKENKYFANIKGEEKTLSNLDIKNMSVQGIGRSVRRDGEDDYSDQIGGVSDTTATFILNLSTSFASVNNITRTQAPGNKISNIVFTIFPKNGYNILASDFYHKDITFVQTGKNIEATLNLDLIQPNSNTTYTYDAVGKATKIPISVSGNFTIAGFNFAINTNTSGTFTVQGGYGTEQIIAERIVTADSGYFIQAQDITINNTTIRINKVKISDYKYKIIESIFIPKNNTSLDYTVSISPSEEVIPDPVLISKQINTDDLLNDEETRDFTILGEEGAGFILKVSDSSSEIYSVTKTFDGSGKIILPITFPAGNTAETYTIAINTLAGTDFGDNFGSQNITIERSVRSRKSVTFVVLYSSSINDKIKIDDYRGETFSNEKIEFTLTLPSGAYVVDRNPLNSDVNFGDNENNASMSFEPLSFDAINTNELTVTGYLSINQLIEDEIYTLDVSSLVGENITTTFDVSALDKNGASTGNFTASASTYTVTGGSGTTVTPTETFHFFDLTPSAGYIFEDTIVADDFELLDASNTDVLTTYAANNELLLKKIGGVIKIGFKTKPFSQLSSDSTITLYPKPGTLTKAVVVTEVEFLQVALTTRAYFDGDDQSNAPLGGRLMASFGNRGSKTNAANFADFDATTAQLVQFTIDFTKEKDIAVIDPSEFSDSNLFSFTSVDSEYTLATAGTYTAANGSGNVTITGGLEYNTATYILTINLLVDLAGDTSISVLKGDLTVNLLSDKYYDGSNLKDKYTLVSIKETDCSGFTD